MIKKKERLNQIKEAADSLFAQMPYTEIAITTIADKLIWSRANLYKYVTIKEEIFHEISARPALSADDAYKPQLNVQLFAAAKIR